MILLAHSWYPLECCSGNDCKPVACHLISQEERTNAHGYAIELYVYSEVGWKPFYIMAEKARPSPDDKCHVCIWNGTQNLRCLFLPVRVS